MLIVRDHGATTRGAFLTVKAFLKAVAIRVARWLAFKPKIQIWVNFGVA
jgi:hypothetical protein